MQIDPNSQAPIGSTSLSENAPRQTKKERTVAVKRWPKEPEIADVDPDTRLADSSAAVLESTNLEQVARRVRSGAYNTREMAEAIARRLLGSGDL